MKTQNESIVYFGMSIPSSIVKWSISSLLWFFINEPKPLYISSLLNSRIEKPTAKAICLDISGGVEETAIVSLSRIILPLKFALRHLSLAFLDLHIISTSRFLNYSTKWKSKLKYCNIENCCVIFWAVSSVGRAVDF